MMNESSSEYKRLIAQRAAEEAELQAQAAPAVKAACDAQDLFSLDELEEAAARAPFHPKLSSINDAGGPEWSWWETKPGVFQSVVNGKRRYTTFLSPIDDLWHSTMVCADYTPVQPAPPCRYLWLTLAEVERWEDEPQCVECRSRSAEGPDYVCDRCQGDRKPSQEEAL